jgi:hypothetical protein
MAYATKQLQVVPAITLTRITANVRCGNRFDMVDDLAGGTAIFTESKLGIKKSIAAFLPSGAGVEFP